MTRKTLLLLMLTVNLLYGQDTNLYKELGVKEIEEYIFDLAVLNEKEDSVLSRKIYLDSLGRIKSQFYKTKRGRLLCYNHYYKDGKISKIRRVTNEGKNEKTEVAYKYNRKGNLRLKKKYSNGSLVGKEFYTFDWKGRIREKVVKNFSYSGKKKYLYLYNEKGQKIKEYSPSKEHSDLVFEYDEHGNEIVIHKIDNEDEKVFYIVKEYDSLNRLVKIKKYCDSKFYLPDIKQKIQAIEGDVWVRKFILNEKGLVVESRQWLNNILVGIKKIKYRFTSNDKEPTSDEKIRP